MTNHFYSTVAALAVMAAAGTSASAVNLLTNGGFETGSFSGFTVNDQTGDDHPAVVIRTDGVGRVYPMGAFLEGIPSDPLTNAGPDQAGGTYAAYFSSDSTTGGAAPSETLSQTVNNLIVGQSYTFGFDYYLPANGQVNQGNSTLGLSVNGLTFTTLSAAAQPTQQWLNFSGAFTATGTSATVTLTYTAPGASINGKDFVVDRVFLAGTQSLVPEPASWAMMVAGFGLMGAALRRKRTNVSFA